MDAMEALVRLYNAMMAEDPTDRPPSEQDYNNLFDHVLDAAIAAGVIPPVNFP